MYTNHLAELRLCRLLPMMPLHACLAVNNHILTHTCLNIQKYISTDKPTPSQINANLALTYCYHDHQSITCMCDKIDPPLTSRPRMRENVDAGAHGRSSDQQQHCRETYIFAVHE